MKKIDIYPSTIYIDRVPDENYIIQSLDIASKLYEQQVSNDCSVRNGWQSPKDLYSISQFAKLADLILHKVKDEIITDKTEPFISAMWLNVHELYGFNHVHVHAGSWYSGVFYLKCSTTSGNITFTDPRPAAEMSQFHQHINGELKSISPAAGDLILFPSWLPHFVEPNMSNTQRISISFNIDLDI
jgi:uncharacterized protein (TIGR02466 family)